MRHPLASPPWFEQLHSGGRLRDDACELYVEFVTRSNVHHQGFRDGRLVRWVSGPAPGLAVRVSREREVDAADHLGVASPNAVAARSAVYLDTEPIDITGVGGGRTCCGVGTSEITMPFLLRVSGSPFGDIVIRLVVEHGRLRVSHPEPTPEGPLTGELSYAELLLWLHDELDLADPVMAHPERFVADLVELSALHGVVDVSRSDPRRLDRGRVGALLTWADARNGDAYRRVVESIRDFSTETIGHASALAGG